ncbi:mitochondrial 18 KDa protein-domain-containing protein [Armillaria luteobubalina]|uniref:Mitochondrial fission process protein 1 n=1 Tax=Armillaria luteobubalina TaxID=153913 RepID=A0AA39QBP3_9AGAR|nr:mitochondrial 18 KDa protein-domain-containing protein [Armillaria luteobubalina]
MSPSTQSVTGAIEQEVDHLTKDNVDSTDSDIRYLAYGARLRTALRASTRYIAYTSDVGEAFRPVVPPWAVTAAYGVSWLYLGGDVAYESYKAHRRGPSAVEAAHFSESTRLGLVAVQRATFQSIASMALPALTIHTIVKQTKKAFVNVQNPKLKAWGPTLSGLAVVPALPYLYDHPVEVATDRAFDWIKEKMAETGTHTGKEDKEL